MAVSRVNMEASQHTKERLKVLYRLARSVEAGESGLMWACLAIAGLGNFNLRVLEKVRADCAV